MTSPALPERCDRCPGRDAVAAVYPGTAGCVLLCAACVRAHLPFFDCDPVAGRWPVVPLAPGAFRRVHPGLHDAADAVLSQAWSRLAWEAEEQRARK